MNLERYPVEAKPDFKQFDFFSVGPKGTIRKVVLFQQVRYNIYNVAFGDWDEDLQKIDTTTRSNNEDRDKVLATVASAVVEFFEHYPGATICAKGNLPANTRLYQIKINKNSGEIGERFCIRGLFNDALEDLVAGRNYESFALWKK